MNKKLLSFVFFLSFSPLSFASPLCESIFYVDLPVIPGVDSSTLRESREIFSKVQKQNFVSGTGAKFILTFQHGDYVKDGISLIATRMTVKSMFGKILYRSEKEEVMKDPHNLGLTQLRLMRKHVNELPPCKQLSRYLR